MRRVPAFRAALAKALARAAVESIAYQVADLLDAMQKDAGNSVEELRVDGGAAANDYLMQFQSDILGSAVVRPAITETTALGAAYLAGLGVGLWRTTGDLAGMTTTTNEKRFEPRLPASQAAALRGRWNEAVSRAKAWQS